MPRKKSGEKLIPVPVGVSPGQKALVERLRASGLYGTTESDVIRYFMVQGMQDLAKTGVLRVKIPK
jgi:hypothetical protein